VGEEVWLDVVSSVCGNVAGYFVLWVRKSGWMLCPVGEGVLLDIVCCG